jgi:hypothetical protein
VTFVPIIYDHIIQKNGSNESLQWRKALERKLPYTISDVIHAYQSFSVFSNDAVRFLLLKGIYHMIRLMLRLSDDFLSEDFYSLIYGPTDTNTTIEWNYSVILLLFYHIVKNQSNTTASLRTHISLKNSDDNSLDTYDPSLLSFRDDSMALHMILEENLQHDFSGRIIASYAGNHTTRITYDDFYQICQNEIQKPTLSSSVNKFENLLFLYFMQNCQNEVSIVKTSSK